MLKDGMLKDDLLYVFQRLYEKEKLTKEEYHVAVRVILRQQYQRGGLVAQARDDGGSEADAR